MDPVTIRTLKVDPKFTKIKEFDLGFEVKPSRRSIFNVMSIVGKKPRAWVQKYGASVIECYLGADFRDAWMQEYSNTDNTITIDMLQDFENNKAEIEQAIETTIDGIVAPRLDNISKAKDLIFSYINDTKDKISITDIQWMISFCSLKMVPDDYSAAIFKSNKHIRSRILKDIEINRILSSFLETKSVVGINNNIKAW
jgi:hypothetical protein